MSNPNILNPLTRQEELLHLNQESAIFYINKEYKKEEIVKLAQSLQQRLIKEQNDNMFLKRQINALSQQQQSPRRTNNQENEINQLSQQCNIAINRYDNLLIKYEKLFQTNQKIFAQIQIAEVKSKNLIAIFKQQSEETQKKIFLYQKQIFQAQEIFKALDQQRIQYPQGTQYQNIFNKFQENQKQIQVQCSNTIDNCQNLIEQGQINKQNYQKMLVTINQVKQAIEDLNMGYLDFKKTKNITDNQINKALEMDQNILQLNKVILNQIQEMLIQMLKDLDNQEEKNYQLKIENDKLRDLIKDQEKLGQKEIDENKQILQSLKEGQNQRLTQTNTNQIIDNYHRFKDTLRLLNEEFYQILLQFSSQGLTISQLQLKLQDQQNVLYIIENYKQKLQQNTPSNSQQLSEILNQFKNFFNRLKQYIDDENKLIDVFHIQDKFFSSYEKVIKKLLETENLEQHL